MDNKLAINGEKPVREKYLPYAQQWIDEEDIKRVSDVLRGDYLTTGPSVREFEQNIAEYTGSKYAVAVSNGTTALHCACFAAGIGPGDEVITTPMTFAASSNCVLYQGGTPVFADIKSDTYNIDPEDIERKITSRTKAIIPVDFTGQPTELDEIRRLADKHNLVMIEDAAHALGATYKGGNIGTVSDMTEFSFHPVKHITTGEGGVITTNSKEYYERVLLFRTHGITRNPSLMTKNEGGWYYEQLELGNNYRITDIQCVLGMSQLKRLGSFIARRKEIVKRYNEAFKNLEGIITPYQRQECDSSWHLYVIQLELEKLKVCRKEVFDALKAENIGVNVHYIPVHYHPYYQKLGYKKGICPNAEKLYERIITLPLFPKMNDKDVSDVIEAVYKVISYYKR